MSLPSASELQAILSRLESGYYNDGAVTAQNPGGLAADGHVDNFPAALADVGNAAQVFALPSMTSVTELTISTGPHVLTLDYPRGFVPGGRVIVAHDAARWMFGQVDAYDPAGPTLTVTATAVAGSGTYSSWTVQVAGVEGPQGDPGTDGVDGVDGDVVGPGASTDTGIATWDGTNGNALRSTGWTIDPATGALDAGGKALLSPRVDGGRGTVADLGAVAVDVSRSVGVESGLVIEPTADISIDVTGWAGVAARLQFYQVVMTGGGDHTITWAFVDTWIGGSAPTLSTGTGVDVLVFFTTDGGATVTGLLSGSY